MSANSNNDVRIALFEWFVVIERIYFDCKQWAFDMCEIFFPTGRGKGNFLYEWTNSNCPNE